MAKVASKSFEHDRHTQMKNFGTVPYDMEVVAHKNFPPMVDSKTVAFTKAIDNETGEIMGWCAWGFRGLSDDEIPIPEGAPEKNDTLGDSLWRDKRDTDTDVPAAEKKDETPKTEEPPEEEPSEGVKRLTTLTSNDMNDTMKDLMPEGTRCMFIASFTVDPKYQRRGVGRALLKWGTDFADSKGLWIWVHSSQGAVPAYEAGGFVPFRSLEFDLDEYAPDPPSAEFDYDGSGKWGRYALTWMKYLPK